MDTLKPDFFQTRYHVLDRIEGPVYRRLSKREYAEDFCRGYIRLSTLATCRNHFDPLRRDDGEAIHFYASGPSLDLSTKAGLASAHQMGFGVGPNCVAENCFGFAQIPDALLLCFSERSDLTALGSCVKIIKPRRFFSRLSEAICRAFRDRHPVGILGHVRYRDREFFGADPQPAPIGFIKPVSYAPEAEVRMLWQVSATEGLDPDIYCPSIRTLCSLL